jgi:DNA polymerase-3 subunit alpha
MPIKVIEDEIVSITKFGKACMMYDIAMESPANNYVANGIIVHNTSGLSKLSKQLGINSFKLLYDASALYRPGSLHSGQTATYVLRHNGKQKWDYDHPLLEPITKDTKGILIYQEQIMQIMHSIGAFSWATSEMSRKIITKSKGKQMFEKLRDEFIANAQREHGIPPEESGKIFDVVSTFGSYSFNKSHSVSYSMISYYCAWLKTYYPKEFFCSVLGSEEDSNKFADYLCDAKSMGIKIEMPDINKSKLGFAAAAEGIIGGFFGITGIGAKTAERFISNQPYSSLLDFIRRGKPNLTCFKALVTIGACRDFVKNRKVIFDNAESILKYAKENNAIKTDEELLKNYDQTQPDWLDKDLASNMLAYYSIPGDKPAIDYYEDRFLPYLKDKYEKIGSLEFDDYVNERWIKGMVTFINFKQEGLEGSFTMFDNVLERRYAHLNVNDGTGNVLVHLAPEQYTAMKHYLEKSAGFPVIIKGHSIKDFNKIYCDAMIVLNNIDESNPIIKYIMFDKRKAELEKVKKLVPGMQIGVIEGVSYKVSKAKKAYARIQFTDGRIFICMHLDSQIFISGEIIIFSSRQPPFMDIIKRL